MAALTLTGCGANSGNVVNSSNQVVSTASSMSANNNFDDTTPVGAARKLVKAAIDLNMGTFSDMYKHSESDNLNEKAGDLKERYDQYDFNKIVFNQVNDTKVDVYPPDYDQPASSKTGFAKTQDISFSLQLEKKNGKYRITQLGASTKAKKID